MTPFRRLSIPARPLAHQLNRALGLTSVLVAVGALAIGGVIFFLIPRFTTGYLSALNLQPNADDRLQRQRRRSAKSAKSSRTPPW